ncbi:50s ribosomal protein l19 [Trichosporon asahii var. asahii CBS 8904]|uniref:50s ribosomal protein l19 n=1 Tax=Trichosporon asahii var. asahii (strain CBS 8904) TaxID=1220162 RepID=K1WRT8_TRIAC|nr:50s ribosomal protein l19 [Trichosporon asahii var. asahii CBS 8904]
MLRRAVDMLRALPAGPSRGFASSARASEGYPFNAGVVVKPPTPIPTPSLLKPKNGWSVVEHVNKTLREQYDQRGLLDLFARRGPQRLKTGSVLSVTTWTGPEKKNSTLFSGVLMAVRRRGVDTSFTLRNVVQQTGAEMSFKVCSPLLKEIKIIRRAEGRKKDTIRDLRRARVNYLRDRPDIMHQIAAALKSHAAQEGGGKAAKGKGTGRK